ncbi:FAD synthetase, putative [Phytophthora infestans T30-4]|uniref:FAD synthase n=2 Tax=Phytophthora infestans TaxID=4787 RepID=D0MWH8_PHYIT|nr:FAD synthetase, putative [Phytophthora infestans T30-4]KAF4036698.1 Phosphoadenosine phosphosulfate reductase family [Phytophthora infestans]EEY63991.1 FAD synthetase, putative [Phytophthora infestans T30-4]KAF4128664.1 Phosphoadenosine phosphosulfate reductase family [Phytophthora infestans]KAI9986614.1 hypothetical protein PInf_025567 [Phytophthora infestans]KAI9986690.1 hypothetical protein PInf_025645 [Phytophthora infestans]|eukprot:XP_002907427.1 FAD synthetase, putative [Phytophthora infestans T30-4]
MTNDSSMRSILLRFDLFFAGADAAMQKRLQKALDVMRSAIDIFGLEGVCFSFNGGKDSTVVLHLLRIVVAKRVLEEAQLAHLKAEQEAENGPKTTVTSPRNSFVSADLLQEEELEARVKTQLQRVPVMYFDSYDQFPEVREFTEECNTKFALSCHVYKCSFVEGVKDILDKLQVKGIYMGVRGGDPYTEDMEHFSPSSPGWPPFLRVNPILKWTYDDVWSFLRDCQLEYCSLYDHGYTSLGNIFDTVQNPELWRTGEDGKEGYYLPAYELKDGSSERCGRQKKAHTTSKSE